VKKVLFVAVDGGPIEVMGSLLKEVEGDLLQGVQEGISLNHTLIQYDTIVVGTSGSRLGRELEFATRIVAKKLLMPLIVIEDYIGNYKSLKAGKPDILLVDSEESKLMYQKQLERECPQIEVVNNPRYDELRINMQQYRLKIQAIQQDIQQQSVLWVGQPETEDAVATLTQIIPILKEKNIPIYFKAHPRDTGYHQGIYGNIFKQYGMVYQDVTDCSLDSILTDMSPQLLLTQFSSMAIEAGFYGIPAVHVLFETIGQKRLFEDKGYTVPPHCNLGASWVVTNTHAFKQGIESLFFDAVLRDKVIEAFDKHFGLMRTSEEIKAIILTTKHKE